MKLFNSKLKKNPVFLEEPFRVFHHCFFRCFNLTIDFYHCFRVFSLLIALVHFITVSPGIFISPLILLLFSRVFSFTNVLYVAVFCHVLRFCVAVPWVLQIFTLRRFLPYTPSRHLAPPLLLRLPWGQQFRFEGGCRVS